MVDKHNQIKKLVYNKRVSDSGDGYRWNISVWKIALWMIVAIIALVLMYSCFVQEQGNFLKSVLFYAIIIMIVTLVVWLVGAFVFKARKLVSRFLIAWVLLLGLYLLLGTIFEFTGIMTFHYGVATWLVISILAVGSRNIGDHSLDKLDLACVAVAVIVFTVANAPIFEAGGFFAQVDVMIAWLGEKLALFSSLA